MIISKDSLISFVVVALLACNGVLASTLRFALEPNQLLTGQRTTLVLRIPVEGLPDLTVNPPVVHDELLTKAESLRIADQDYTREGNELVWTYHLVPTKLGTVTVPPIEIQIGTQSFSSESVTLTIASTRKDGDEELRPDFGPESFPMRWGPWIKLVLLLLLLVGGGLASYRWWLHRMVKIPKAEPKLMAPEESPLEWFQKRILEIRRALENSQNGEVTIDELTSAIRQFFEKASRNPVETWTTTEFRTRFSRDELAQQITLVLNRCDAWKFGRESDIEVKDMAYYCLSETEKILLP